MAKLLADKKSKVLSAMTEFPQLHDLLPALVCRLGWNEYSALAPARAQFILNFRKDIQSFETCAAQWPEAMCDYTTAGFLHEAKESKISGFYPRGTDGHFWFYDVTTKYNIDLTAHQFKEVDKLFGSSEPKILVYTAEQASLFNFPENISKGEINETLREGLSQYLEDKAKARSAFLRV